jgi:enoyl-CoA hydratase
VDVAEEAVRTLRGGQPVEVQAVGIELARPCGDERAGTVERFHLVERPVQRGHRAIVEPVLPVVHAQDPHVAVALEFDHGRRALQTLGPLFANLVGRSPRRDTGVRMSIEVRRHGRTAVVVLNRPQVRNAMNASMALQINETLDELSGDDDTWAVVLTGAGDKAFCAGQDLKELAGHQGAGAPGRPELSGGWGGITGRQFPKPLLAAVNGVAFGGGFEIVLCCDLVVAEAHAQFALPEVKRGVVAAAGGLVRVARRLPPSLALEMVLTGESISADQALRHGLVNRVVPTGKSLASALDLAALACAGSPLAVRASKQVVRAVMSGGETEAFELQRRLLAQLRTTDDFEEGPRAFVEKRPPQWTGA